MLVFIVPETDAYVYFFLKRLCEGGELLDLISSRGGGYAEDDAKTIIVQILGVVAFCHLQGVVHRDLKSENFLFAGRDGDAPLKIIDFGPSHFSRPDEHLNDFVGSAYYVAPEVLHRSYSIEADIWSIGVIAYMLLCTICRGNEAGLRVRAPEASLSNRKDNVIAQIMPALSLFAQNVVQQKALETPTEN
ncbi:hypothetical protein ACET3Z_005223 [Daucus carota]